MRKKEQRLWDSMKRRKTPGLWLQRVENVVAEGMPDLFCASSNGTSCWVELKAVVRPEKSTSKLLASSGLRASQIAWHDKASRIGLRSYVLIRDNEMNLYLLPGAVATEMNDWSIERCEAESLANHWEGVMEVIAG